MSKGVAEFFRDLMERKICSSFFGHDHKIAPGRPLFTMTTKEFAEYPLDMVAPYRIAYFCADRHSESAATHVMSCADDDKMRGVEPLSLS